MKTRTVLPTLKLLLTVIAKTGNSLRGAYQRRMLKAIFDHAEIVLTATRQCGKSYIASWIAVLYILCGHTVIIALPTLKQGERTIFTTISQLLYQVERSFPRLLKRLKNNQSDIHCANGGRLLGLSTDESANKEGYSAALIIIDEGHRAKKKVLAELSPILTNARKSAMGKIIVLGIGGYRNSLLESVKRLEGVGSCEVTWRDVVIDDPLYQNQVDSDRRLLTPDEFAQEYECASLNADTKYIFNDIPTELDIPDNFPAPTYYFGIDLGRNKDATVVTVVTDRWGFIEVVDQLEIRRTPYTLQKDMIFEFLATYSPNNFLASSAYNLAVECNSEYAMYDMLQEKAPYTLGIVTNANNKHHRIQAIRKLIMEGKFACHLPDYKEELEGLEWTVSPEGKNTYTHSDKLSSLLVAMAMVLSY